MGLTKSPNSGVYKTTKSPRPPVGAVIEPVVLAEPEAPVEAEVPVSPLFALTNADLQDLADDEGIELPPRATKAEMVAVIEEA